MSTLATGPVEALGEAAALEADGEAGGVGAVDGALEALGRGSRAGRRRRAGSASSGARRTVEGPSYGSDGSWAGLSHAARWTIRRGG